MIYSLECGITFHKDFYLSKHFFVEHGMFRGEQDKIATSIVLRIGPFHVKSIVKGHHLKVSGCKQCMKQEKSS